jgi:NAD(P)-dependent dehydrogenase (short-subunit alcohol dehydrogenase family)
VNDLKGKVAVVTGAAAGIGRALADRFVAEGMRVVLVDVDASRLAQVVDDLRAEGAQVSGVSCDVSDPDQVAALADGIVQVDVLCNNAGVEQGAPFTEVDNATWEKVIGVDLLGVLYACQSFLPLLRQGGGGHVVNTSSIAALNGYFPTGTPYVAAKFGVLGLSEALYHEWALHEPTLHISVLCPGFVDTGMANRAAGRPDHPVRAAMVRAAMSGGSRGIAPAVVGDAVIRAIREQRFHILTHPEEAVDAVRQRLRWMETNVPPGPPPGTLSSAKAFALARDLT